MFGHLWRSFIEIAAFLDVHNGAATAIATIFIAIFTLVLAVVTGRQAKLTRTVAEASNRAAGAAERALTELERPWLFLEGATIRLRDPDATPLPPNNWFITLSLRNVGRMPALVEECIFKIDRKDVLPPAPDYSGAGDLTCPSTIGPNDTGDTGTVGPGPGYQGQLVFYGRVTYKELSGRLHHTGFALEVAPHVAAFIRHANDAYDYYN